MFGERLRELRERDDMTQQQLAVLLSLSQQTIDHYEKGRANPSISTINLLANIFNVSSDYLLGRSETALPDNTLRLVAKEWPETISILYRKGKPTPERDKRAAKIMEVAIPAEDVEDD